MNPFGNNYACQNTRSNAVVTKIYQVLEKSYWRANIFIFLMENFSPWQNKICTIHLTLISQDFEKCLAFRCFFTANMLLESQHPLPYIKFIYLTNIYSSAFPVCTHLEESSLLLVIVHLKTQPLREMFGTSSLQALHYRRNIQICLSLGVLIGFHPLISQWSISFAKHFHKHDCEPCCEVNFWW